jgi:hypothetical protein
LTRHSLSLNAAHFPSWQLLALLLSAQKQYTDAAAACQVGAGECHAAHTPSVIAPLAPSEGSTITTASRDFLLLKAKILLQQLSAEELSGAEQGAILTAAFDTFRDLLARLLPAESRATVTVGPHGVGPIPVRTPPDADAAAAPPPKPSFGTEMPNAVRTLTDRSVACVRELVVEV